ncbi:hypothetical protein GCM10028778_20760 [Barrientosiimonas marina]
MTQEALHAHDDIVDVGEITVKVVLKIAIVEDLDGLAGVIFIREVQPITSFSKLTVLFICEKEGLNGLSMTAHF